MSTDLEVYNRLNKPLNDNMYRGLDEEGRLKLTNRFIAARPYVRNQNSKISKKLETLRNSIESGTLDTNEIHNVLGQIKSLKYVLSFTNE